MALVLVCGAAGGLALALMVREVLPSSPDLAEALRRLDPDAAPSDPQPQRPAGLDGWPEVIGGRLLAALGDNVRLPRADLALLRRTSARYLGVKVLWATGGLVFPQLLAALLSWAGISLPFLLSGGVSLGLAVLLWLTETQQVRQRAQELRRQYRWAIASYLERVELARAAGIGASKALSEAARVGDSWTFTRLRTVLEQAQLSGLSPWEALRQLADEIDVPELSRPAETLALAGEDGASVRDSLTAQTRQLRIALLADAKAEANSASERMIMPVVGLVLILVIFVMYAAVQQVFGT